MAITASDIKFKRSTKSGSAGNSLTQSDPQASLGKFISTTEVPATLHGLFTQMSAADNAAKTAQYSCVFVHNAHATLTLTGAVAWLNGGDPAGGAVVTIAVDSTAASLIAASADQAKTATTITAPGTDVTGLSYSAPTSAAAGLAMGDIAPGYCKALWVCRTGNDSAAVTESITLAVTGGTLA